MNAIPASMVSPRLDTHLHAFHRRLACAPDARYRPGYDAPFEQFLALMERNGIDHAVLIQPSFLGTDNAYLVKALGAAPRRFRGVAVVEPAATDSELEALSSAGVVGLRYNMIGHDAAAYLCAARRSLAARVGRRGWLLEVQCREAALAPVLDFAAAQPFKVIIDHFGIPDGTRRGFDLLLRSPANVHVKISAPYRSASQDHALLTGELLSALGPDRLLWGSDWPFTGHETGRTYEGCVQTYKQSCPDAATRTAIDRAGAALFGFAA